MSSTKLFISHASEDKADFVEPLVEALQAAGFEVWYDKYELTLGDSLLQKNQPRAAGMRFWSGGAESGFFSEKVDSGGAGRFVRDRIDRTKSDPSDLEGC